MALSLAEKILTRIVQEAPPYLAFHRDDLLLTPETK